MTDQDMLTAVEAAIAAQLTGNVASYSINGRSLTRLPLSELYRMRKELQFAVARAQQGAVTVAQFRPPE